MYYIEVQKYLFGINGLIFNLCLSFLVFSHLCFSSSYFWALSYISTYKSILRFKQLAEAKKFVEGSHCSPLNFYFSTARHKINETPFRNVSFHMYSYSVTS